MGSRTIFLTAKHEQDNEQKLGRVAYNDPTSREALLWKAIENVVKRNSACPIAVLFIAHDSSSIDLCPLRVQNRCCLNSKFKIHLQSE